MLLHSSLKSRTNTVLFNLHQVHQHLIHQLDHELDIQYPALDLHLIIDAHQRAVTLMIMMHCTYQNYLHLIIHLHHLDVVDQNLTQDLDHLVANIIIIITNQRVVVDLIRDHHQDVVTLHHLGLAHVIPLHLVQHCQYLIHFNLTSNLYQIKI